MHSRPLPRGAESSIEAWCFAAWCIKLSLYFAIRASSGLFAQGLVHVGVSLKSVHVVVSSLLWSLQIGASCGLFADLCISLSLCGLVCLGLVFNLE